MSQACGYVVLYAVPYCEISWSYTCVFDVNVKPDGCKMATLKKSKHWFSRTNCRLMQAENIVECSEHSAILLTCI